MERDFLGAIGRQEKASGCGAVEEEDDDGGSGAEQDQPDGNPGAAPPPVPQWQFPANPSAAPAFLSFRAGAEDGSKDFSISGFRRPAARPDSFDCVTNQASLPDLMLTCHQRQSHLGLDAPPPYVVTTTHGHGHGHRVQQGMEYGVTTHHLPGGGLRMVQAPPARHNAPPPFNPMLRSQSFHGVTSPFKNHSPFTVSSAPFGGGSTTPAVGAYGARNPRNQNLAQLTIFYNGSVNVFDNVTVEKAQELVLLASRTSIPSPPSTARKPDTPISATAPAKAGSLEVLPARQIVIQKPEPSVPNLSSSSSPMSVVPHSVIHPMSTSKCTTESTGPSTAAQLPVVAPTSQAQASLSQPMALATTSAAAIMPRAVPQARKASLARFLEKRKERVTSVEPYPASKSPLESSDTTGSTSASAPSKSSPRGNAATSGNGGEEPLCLHQHQPRSISFGSEVQHPIPSTKLQI